MKKMFSNNKIILVSVLVIFLIAVSFYLWFVSGNKEVTLDSEEGKILINQINKYIQYPDSSFKDVSKIENEAKFKMVLDRIDYYDILELPEREATGDRVDLFESGWEYYLDKGTFDETVGKVFDQNVKLNLNDFPEKVWSGDSCAWWIYDSKNEELIRASNACGGELSPEGEHREILKIEKKFDTYKVYSQVMYYYVDLFDEEGVEERAELYKDINLSVPVEKAQIYKTIDENGFISLEDKKTYEANKNKLYTFIHTFKKGDNDTFYLVSYEIKK